MLIRKAEKKEEKMEKFYGKLTGKRIMDRRNQRKGYVAYVDEKKIVIIFGNYEKKYPFPAAFASTLLLEDEELQQILEGMALSADFANFKELYTNVIQDEVVFLKLTGGKKYKIIDGEQIHSEKNGFTYFFETDSELHFPDGTAIKLWFPDKIVPAQIISCEEFNIMLQTRESIGKKVEVVEFTAESWHLLEALSDRICELDSMASPIAYDVACKGKYKIDKRSCIKFGQDTALRKTSTQPISFVWGPPGTGKTTTLAEFPWNTC